MNPAVWLLVALLVPASAALTGLIRRGAIAHGRLDHPNERSSHEVATPRGGGLAVVICALAGFATLWLSGALPTHAALALIGGGALVALAGQLDDLARIGIRARLLMQAAAAVWAVYWLGGLREFPWQGGGVELGMAGTVLAAVALVWLTNLFNFMDGLDGLAASEAIFITVAGALLAPLAGVAANVSSAAAVLAAATAGFLVWNWPPARIFLGDVGSGFLGYTIGVVALMSANQQPSMLEVWLVLAGVFVVDATVTLLRRLARRERVHQAHRSHAYQVMARRCGAHRPVVLAVLAINLLWLAPWAWARATATAPAWWPASLSLLPLIAVAMLIGAGARHDSR